MVTTTAYRSAWADDDVIALKEMATKFFETEALPHRERWAAQKCVDRDFWYKAGELGLLCASVPEQYGGGGGTLAHEFAIKPPVAKVDSATRYTAGWSRTTSSPTAPRSRSSAGCRGWPPGNWSAPSR